MADSGRNSVLCQIQQLLQLGRAKVGAMAIAAALWKREVLGSIPSGAKCAKRKQVMHTTTKEMAQSGLDALLRENSQIPQIEYAKGQRNRYIYGALEARGPGFDSPETPNLQNHRKNACDTQRNG